jgi:hypothetical protein
MLELDGYAMRATSPSSRELVVAITATERACPECLAPRDVVLAIIAKRLAECGVAISDVEIDVLMPSESSGD